MSQCGFLSGRTCSLTLIALRLRLPFQPPAPIAHILCVISVYLPPRNFITLHYAYFIGTSLVASIIFWGSSTPPRSISYPDSLFFAVSAMTLAGLNTINLSELNTFQQFILFVLIMLGSAIFVSLMVVHVRRKAFERRFKRIVEDQRRQRRVRSGIKHPLSSVVLSPRRQTGPEVGDINVQGKVLHSTTDQPDEKSSYLQSSECGIHPPQDRSQGHDHPHGLSQEDNPAALTAGNEDSVPIDDGVTRRIAFANPISPTRTRQRTRVFSMQGVGARQDVMNHPSRSSLSVYPIISRGASEAKPDSSQRNLDLFSAAGFVGRNSQFSSLNLAQREELGGVEYRAVTFLAVIVPIYFVLWQLLGSLGLGAYIARNRPDTTQSNGLNPWYIIRTRWSHMF